MSLRPPREDEFDAMLELMNAHQLAAFGEADYTADDLRTWLTSPYVEIERDIRVLERDGRLIAYADVDATREEPPLWWCDVKVAPDVDAAPVVAELVAWLDERAQEGRLRVWTSETDERIVSAFSGSASSRSDTPTGWRSTSPATPASPSGPTASRSAPPPRTTTGGSTPQSSRSGKTRTTRSTRRSRSGRTGTSSASRTTQRSGSSRARATSSPASRICRQDSVDPTAGYVAMLGVRRPWRRQGLGEALLAHSFAEFRRRGYTRGTLGVDASSMTGATRLYERAGMSVYRDTVFLERPVQR